jgi:hypothetical protein
MFPRLQAPTSSTVQQYWMCTGGQYFLQLHNSSFLREGLVLACSSGYLDEAKAIVYRRFHKGGTATGAEALSLVSRCWIWVIL